MDTGSLLGRGISFPPRVGPDGRVAWSEGEDNVRECIKVVLLSEQRERLMLPQFGGGLGQYLFEPNVVATRTRIEQQITAALSAWEPRIAVTSVTVDADPADPRSAIAVVTYQLVATQTIERVTLRVTLAG
jgi:phage baseplate assembly protein W